MPSATAIAFDYRPSRRLQAAIVAVALLAGVSIACSALPRWLDVALLLAVAAYAATALWQLRRHAGWRVGWHDAGHWSVAREGGATQTAELRDASVRGDWIVLRLRLSDGRTLPLVLAGDNSDAELRRRLRVRLARADALALPAA